MRSLRSILLIASAATLFIAFYILDHGIFIGSSSEVIGNGLSIHKSCRYLFITGPAEVDTPEGTIFLWTALQSRKTTLREGGFSEREIAEWQEQELANGGAKALKDFGIQDRGYCRLLAK